MQAFSPINILSRLPNIGGNLGYGKQEDAHEFMRFAIYTMQSVCLDEFGGEKSVHPTAQETTLIQHIFGGHLQSQWTLEIGTYHQDSGYALVLVLYMISGYCNLANQDTSHS